MKLNKLFIVLAIILFVGVIGTQKKEAPVSETGLLISDTFEPGGQFVVQGGPVYVLDPVMGDSYEFFEKTDFISYGDNPEYILDEDMTLFLTFKTKQWFEHSDYLVQNGVFRLNRRGEWAGDKLYYLLYTDTVTPDDGDSAWSYRVGVYSVIEFAEERWYSIVLRRENNVMSFWVNGKSTRSHGFDFGNSTGNIRTDAFTELKLGGFNGTITDFKLYNRALTNEEVGVLFGQLVIQQDQCPLFSEGMACQYSSVQIGECLEEECRLPRVCDYNYQCDDDNVCTTDTCDIFGQCRYSDVPGCGDRNSMTSQLPFIIMAIVVVGGLYLVFAK